jgi:hypothetical protein
MWQDMKQQPRHSSECHILLGGGGQSDLSLNNYGLRLLSKKTKYVCNIQQNSLVANVCFVNIAVSVSACNNSSTSEQGNIIFQVDAFH